MSRYRRCRDREVSPTGSRSAGACPPRSLWNSQRIFTHQRPIQLSRANFEECLKSGADSGFVRNAVLTIPVKGGVIGGYRFMGGFDVECWHDGKFSIVSLELQEKIVWRSNVREGQALALREGTAIGASDNRERQARALRYRRCSVLP